MLKETVDLSEFPLLFIVNSAVGGADTKLYEEVLATRENVVFLLVKCFNCRLKCGRRTFQLSFQAVCAERYLFTAFRTLPFCVYEGGDEVCLGVVLKKLCNFGEKFVLGKVLV